MIGNNKKSEDIKFAIIWLSGVRMENVEKPSGLYVSFRIHFFLNYESSLEM